MNSINGGHFVWISGVYKQQPAPRMETKCQTGAPSKYISDLSLSQLTLGANASNISCAVFLMSRPENVIIYRSSSISMELHLLQVQNQNNLKINVNWLFLFTTGDCGEHEYKCKNGRCIPDEVVCDDYDNCGDWSDEGTSGCGLSKYDVTGDIYNNCGDWSDEGTSGCGLSKYDVTGDKYNNCGDWSDDGTSGCSLSKYDVTGDWWLVRWWKQ